MRFLIYSALTFCLWSTATLSQQSADLKQAQRQLAEVGCFDRAIDGRSSLAFRSALRCFQKLANLPPTGELDSATTSALQRADTFVATAPSPMTGPCRATGPYIECRLEDGSFAQAEGLWARTAATQIILAQKECWRSAISGVWSDAIPRAFNCARTKGHDNADMSLDIAVLSGEKTQARADSERPAAKEQAKQAEVMRKAAQKRAQLKEDDTAETGPLDTAETGPLGVSDRLIEKLQKQSSRMSPAQPDSIQVSIFAGTRNAAFYKRVYNGDFASLTPNDRRTAFASYTALLMKYDMLARQNGQSCLFPGDRTYQFQLNINETTNFGGHRSETYVQSFHVPPTQERTAAAAFGSMGVTPGLNALADMGRVVNREKCRSPRTAHFRENLYRFINGAQPAPMPRVQQPAATSISTSMSMPQNWRLFATQCYRQSRIRWTFNPPDDTAYRCACTERHLRAANLVEVYAAFLGNFNDAITQYWSSPVLNTIHGACQFRDRNDTSNADEILRITGGR